MLTALLSLSLVHDATADEAADKASASRKFLAGYLQVAPLRITTVTTNSFGGVASASSVDLWTVYKGQNTLVRADEFATIGGDTATREKMKTEKTVGVAVGLPMIVVGVGLFAATGYVGSQLDPLDVEAQARAWPVLTGATIGGTVLAGVGYLVWAGPRARQAWPKRYYSEEQATEMVDTYNAEKLKELGITKDDVVEYLKQRTQAPTFTVTPYVAATGLGFTGTF